MMMVMMIRMMMRVMMMVMMTRMMMRMWGAELQYNESRIRPGVVHSTCAVE